MPPRFPQFKPALDLISNPQMRNGGQWSEDPAPVQSMSKLDPSHGPVQDVSGAQHNRQLTKNSPALLKASFADSQDHPTLIVMWSYLTTVQFAAVVCLEYDRYTLRRSSTPPRPRTRSLSSTSCAAARGSSKCSPLCT